jgi:TRAP-type C4-dicarboxylate transport system substrate-binding protein
MKNGRRMRQSSFRIETCVYRTEKRIVRFPAVVGLLTALCFLVSPRLDAQEHLIKFATLAPEGTTWVKIMREYDQAVRKESGGRLGFRIYPNSQQGEDKDVMRRIRLGQLHSAGITGVGIGDISGNLRVLDAPFLFDSYEEVDHIHTMFAKEFEQEFEKHGFILLGWAEVGFVYVFSNTPVSSAADMRGVKMWLWEGDPIAEAAFKALGVNPIPLSIVDVLTSLQTGLINGAYASPLAAVGLQWHTRVKYMLDLALADASGAVVISKKKYDALPPDLQEIILRNGRSYMAELTKKSRSENAQAIETLKKNGVQITSGGTAAERKEYARIGAEARKSLAGSLYNKDLQDRIEKALAEFRAKGKAR